MITSDVTSQMFVDLKLALKILNGFCTEIEFRGTAGYFLLTSVSQRFVAVILLDIMIDSD